MAGRNMADKLNEVVTQELLEAGGRSATLETWLLSPPVRSGICSTTAW
jgi:hypothetical protein